MDVFKRTLNFTVYSRGGVACESPESNFIQCYKNETINDLKSETNVSLIKLIFHSSSPLSLQPPPTITVTSTTRITTTTTVFWMTYLAVQPATAHPAQPRLPTQVLLRMTLTLEQERAALTPRLSLATLPPPLPRNSQNPSRKSLGLRVYR